MHIVGSDDDDSCAEIASALVRPHQQRQSALSCTPTQGVAELKSWHCTLLNWRADIAYYYYHLIITKRKVSTLFQVGGMRSKRKCPPFSPFLKCSLVWHSRLFTVIFQQPLTKGVSKAGKIVQARLTTTFLLLLLLVVLLPPHCILVLLLKRAGDCSNLVSELQKV